MYAAFSRTARYLCVKGQGYQSWKSLCTSTAQSARKGSFSAAGQISSDLAKAAITQRSRALREEFAEAAKAADVDRLGWCWNQVHKRGLPPAIWMFDSQIRVHARRRELKQALQVFNSISAEGLQPSSSSYHWLLHAYSRSGRPPYNIDPKVAFEAEAVVKAMLKAGHDLSRYGYHWLMETQSKAGLGDKAYETYTWMLQRGYPADAYTVAHLVEGYGRSSQPIKAQEVFDTVVEQHNITLSVTPWNILLAAYAKCGHMDGAYATWQKMLALNVVPDIITQRALATAFGGNPQMASSMLAEAQQLQDAAGVDSAAPPSHHTEGSSYDHHHQQSWQMQAVQSGIGPRGPFTLDLHGLSKPAARLALQMRLAFLVANPGLLHFGKGRQLVIVTGIGRNSFTPQDIGSMKAAVCDQLDHLQLPWEPGSNPGRVHIPHSALCQYVKQEQQSLNASTLLHRASIRYLMVFGGMSGVVAAMYVVPKLL